MPEADFERSGKRCGKRLTGNPNASGRTTKHDSLVFCEDAHKTGKCSPFWCMAASGFRGGA